MATAVLYKPPLDSTQDLVALKVHAQADGAGLSPGDVSIAAVSIQPSTLYNDTSGTDAITGFSSTVSVSVTIANVTG